MKNILLSMTILSFFFALGCEKIPSCDEQTCSGHGNCFEGECSCDAGWDGDSCHIQSNLKFNGIYKLNEQCSLSGTRTYYVSLNPEVGNPEGIEFIGLYDSTGVVVKGTLYAGNKTFTVSFQPLDTNNHFIISPFGSFNAAGDTIELQYYVRDSLNQQLETCLSNLTK